MDIHFHGKRALVTGGGRGIGRKLAQSLARCGAKTFVLTKSASSVENIRLDDPSISAIQSDVSEWNSTKAVVESILPIDLLVNNAGIGRKSTFLDSTEADIDDAFGLSYKATFNVSQVVARDLINRKRPGSIVNVSSVSSILHAPGLAVYGSSKAALDSLTKYMALELGREQIRVNAINPTLVPTDATKYVVENAALKEKYTAQIPLRRFGEVNEVVDVAMFLLSDRASLVNGVILPVDGGHSL